MRLLLTSAGITNDSIKKALEELVEKPLSELKMAFIPTAANVEEGDKEWLIRNLSEFNSLGFNEIDIVDISALKKEVIENRLKDVDVLVFGGGNTSYLNYWVAKSELKDLLPVMLENKVYVGISAGSMIASTKMNLGESKDIYYGDGKTVNSRGLGFVDFYIRPHFGSIDFSHVKSENIKKLAKDHPSPIYAIDDQTAVKFIDGKVEVVSEGKWKKFEN